ncbi:MAG: FkbM family methyltransferase [Polyangiales bacterium]
MRRSNALREVQFEVPQCAAPITLRVGTSDLPTFEQVFLERDYQVEFGFTPQIIVDGGANVGYATIYFANRYPNARIFAVEPDLSNFEILKKNVAPYKNVTPIRAALWSRKTNLRISNPDDHKWAIRVEECDGAADDTIPALTIDDLIELGGEGRIDLLKLDVEGAEREVFGANYETWLRKVRAIVIELHDWMFPGCSTAFYRATSQLQFSQSHRGENVILVSTDATHASQS